MSKKRELIKIVDSAEAAEEFSEILNSDVKNASAEDRFIAVDTEFIRENLEVPLLCLVQIATPLDHAFIIDPLAFKDLSFVSNFLENESIIKVFHSAGQDIEVLQQLNIFPKNIYDTQLCEMLLSTQEMISYRSIVYKYLKKKLQKSCGLSDWSKRPLNREQRKYSAEDVIYLCDIYKRQRKALIELGRDKWLNDELKQLEQVRITAITDVDDAHLQQYQLKNDCDPEIFAKLSDWVRQRAREKNISEKQIADERSIKRICKKGKHHVQKMLKYRGLINEDFRDFLLFAKDIVAEAEFRMSKKDPLLLALKLVLEMCSQKNDIASLLIANTENLKNLISNYGQIKSGAKIKCIDGWRKEIFGQYAIKFISGDVSIKMTDGQIELTQMIK